MAEFPFMKLFQDISILAKDMSDVTKWVLNTLGVKETLNFGNKTINILALFSGFMFLLVIMGTLEIFGKYSKYIVMGSVALFIFSIVLNIIGG